MPTLREYLSHELRLTSLPVPFDLERAIDDWVFLIFFVGNDFLPHLPSLEIREGAIDTLIGIWKDALRTNELDGWVTQHGSVELKRLQVILGGLAQREDEIFRKRKEAEERQDRGEKRRRIAQQTNGNAKVGDNTTQGHDYVPVHSLNKGPHAQPAPAASSVDTVATRQANLSAAEKLKREMSGAAEDEDSETKPDATQNDTNTDEQSQANPTDDSAGPDATQTEESPDSRGKKRKATEADVPDGPEDTSAVEQQDVSQTAVDDEQDQEEGPSVLLGTEASDSTTVKGLGGQVPAPLKMLGDNVVEQEDSVR